jgi:glutathione synthase
MMSGCIFAFVMDPMESVEPLADTSFAFMLAAQERGHRLLHVDRAKVSYVNQRVYLHASHVRVNREASPCFEVDKKEWVAANECLAIFIRSDPPFDEAYLNLTWILSFAEAQGVRIVNSTKGLREANEHLYGLHFPELSPASLITSDKEQVVDFVEKHQGNAVAKPIDGHGGFGVVRLIQDDPNMHALIDMLSFEGKTPFLVQEFIASDRPGDKRLLMVDGVLKGVVRRIPPETDFRGNLHIGGRAEACDITQADRTIEAMMAPRLKKDGLFFVGVDVIGDRLIEVNVTSPTLVQELKELTGIDVANEVIQKLEPT